MKKILTISSLLSIAFVMNACYYDKEELLTPPKTGGTGTGCLNYSFTTDINPVIQSSCGNGSGCHGSGSTSGPGALVTYTEIKNAAVQIQSSIQAGRMPLGSSLSGSQIQIISCWVNNGALNN